MSEVKEIVEGLKDITEKLSTWEQDFVQSIDERLSAGIGLTETQVNMVNKIWDEKSQK